MQNPQKSTGITHRRYAACAMQGMLFPDLVPFSVRICRGMGEAYPDVELVSVFHCVPSIPISPVIPFLLLL